MELGEPFIRPRTHSDYWLYAQLFSSTCLVAVVGDHIAGAVMAFRSQEDPADVYIQDVMTHPDHRRTGVAHTLLDHIRARAHQWGCTRIYLTSEPSNSDAHETWTSLGFANLPGDHTVNGVSVTTDYKGPGRSRAVYQLTLR
jgi:GNAT superfamily N-acetyltransferase